MYGRSIYPRGRVLIDAGPAACASRLYAAGAPRHAAIYIYIYIYIYIRVYIRISPYGRRYAAGAPRHAARRCTASRAHVQPAGPTYSQPGPRTASRAHIQLAAISCPAGCVCIASPHTAGPAYKAQPAYMQHGAQLRSQLHPVSRPIGRAYPAGVHGRVLCTSPGISSCLYLCTMQLCRCTQYTHVHSWTSS
jgi:hypothetical protein